ncbi:MAG: NUDIX domain-containing protein [Candidatus Woykebacteria bacterium]
MNSSPNVIPTVAVLIIKDKKVLLVKHEEDAGHEPGTYGLPSGTLEEKEEEKAAAVRELKEETGFIKDEKDLLEFPENFYKADVKRKDGTVKKFSMKVFLSKDFEGELVSSPESTPEWIRIEDLDKYNLLPNVKNAIHAGLKNPRNL